MTSRARIGGRGKIRTRAPIMREVFARMDNLPGAIDVYTEAAGIDRRAISTWRSGTHEPRLWSLVALITALGGRLTVEWTEEKP